MVYHIGLALAFCRLFACCPAPSTAAASIANHSSLCDTSSSCSMPAKAESKKSSNIFWPSGAREKQQQKQQRGKSSSAVAAPKAPKESKTVKKAALPIHFDPAEAPECSSCTQKFGSFDKDALPKQIPLKWRAFNVRSVEQDKALHFYTRLLEAPP